MLQEGVPVDCVNRDDQTALFYAAGFNRTDVIRLLLQKGADVNKRDRSGDTPVQWAVVSNSTEAIAMLIEHGASINITDDYGDKPIDLARRYGSEAAVHMLEQLYVSASEKYIIHYCSCFTLDSRGGHAVFIDEVNLHG